VAGCGIVGTLRCRRSAGEWRSRGGRFRRNLRSVDKDQRWAGLVEQFDPLPQELADLIQRDDTGEVLSWVRGRLNASQRDLDDLRFGNPRLLAQLRDALEQHVEGSELDRYREEWERRAQVCYSWVRRLLAAHSINRESSGSVDTVDLEQLERALGERLDALAPTPPRAELLHVLMLPDFERADRIGEFYRNPKTRTFADLLIDCEEDRTLRAVLVGMLREADRQ
jgi:hypothetical protein